MTNMLMKNGHSLQHSPKFLEEKILNPVEGEKHGLKGYIKKS